MTAYFDYPYRDASNGCATFYLMPALFAMLGPPKGTLLDLGCGNGALARALLSRGWNAFGVDGSASGIAHASETWPGRFFVAEFSKGLPAELAERKFDLIVSTEVIEHLYDPRAFLRLARSALTPAGRLVLSTPYHGYLKNLALAAAGRLDAHFTVGWDGGHIKFFSRRTLELMLTECGFTPRRFAGAGRLPYLWKSMLVEATPST